MANHGRVLRFKNELSAFSFLSCRNNSSSYRRLRGENERNEQKKRFQPWTTLATKREPKLPVIADYKWFSFSHWTTIDSTSDTIQRLTQEITSLEVDRRIVEFLVILTTILFILSYLSRSFYLYNTPHYINSEVLCVLLLWRKQFGSNFSAPTMNSEPAQFKSVSSDHCKSAVTSGLA